MLILRPLTRRFRERRCRHCGGLVIPHRRGRYGLTRPVLVDALGVQLTPGVGVNIFPGDGVVIAEADAACCCTGTTPACCDFVSDGWCVIDALSLTWSMTWDLDGAEIMRRMGFEGDACTGPTTGSASGTMADNSDNCDVHGGVRQTFDGGDYDCPNTIDVGFDVDPRVVFPNRIEWHAFFDIATTVPFFASGTVDNDVCPGPGASVTITVWSDDDPFHALPSLGTMTVTIGGTNPCAPELP